MIIYVCCIYPHPAIVTTRIVTFLVGTLKKTFICRCYWVGGRSKKTYVYIYISPRVYICINTLVYIVPRWGLFLKTASQWTKHRFVECNTIARHIWVSPKECDAIVLKFNQSCFSQNIFDGDIVSGVFSGVKKNTHIFIKTSIIRKFTAASLGDSFF